MRSRAHLWNAGARACRVWARRCRPLRRTFLCRPSTRTAPAARRPTGRPTRPTTSCRALQQRRCDPALLVQLRLTKLYALKNWAMGAFERRNCSIEADTLCGNSTLHVLHGGWPGPCPRLPCTADASRSMGASACRCPPWLKRPQVTRRRAAGAVCVCRGCCSETGGQPGSASSHNPAQMPLGERSQPYVLLGDRLVTRAGGRAPGGG